MPTAMTRSISCRIRAISRRNSPRRGFRCWSRSWRCVPILAAPACAGGGQGYEKHYRALVDCRTIVTADRVRLGCYGLNGGKAGQPFCVTVDAEGEGYDLGGLVDGEPVLKGQIVRVVTTGGGGWGDPLQRELELVLRDVIEGRVSLASAENDYGVIFTTGTTGQPEINEAATKQLRADLKKAQNAAPDMIDRGVGYEKMLRGEHRPRMR